MRLALFFFIFSFVLTSNAVATFEVPALQGPVMDQVGVMEPQKRQELSRILIDFNNRGKAQIQILIVPSLQGETIEQASIKIVDQWKLGDAKLDNGLLFLVAFEDRRMRIEVGQGLEGAIPDVLAKRIIADVVTPYFKARRYSDGIEAGLVQLMALVDQEFVESRQIEAPAARGGKASIFVIFVLLMIIGFFGRFGGGGGRGLRRGRDIGYWGGGGGGWSSGGGSSWGGGGGGFSGGGSSGGW